MFVKLQLKRCVVIGAGTVGARRAQSLIDYGAVVIVVGPRADSQIEKLAENGVVEWVKSDYQESLLEGSFLVVAATNSPEVNAKVVEDANKRNLLVCRADSGEGGSYVTAAAIQRGSLQISVTTGGSSPTLTSVLKSQIEQIFGGEWKEWTALFQALRPTIQLIDTDKSRRAVVAQILNDEYISGAIKSGSVDEAEKAAIQCILSHSV